jgi:hypothetical protein
MGRKTKLTPSLEKRILELIEAGSEPRIAARACGISDSSYTEWMSRGDRTNNNSKLSKEPYISFVEKVETARAVVETKVTGILTTNKDWRAQAWWLERGPARERWAADDTAFDAIVTPAVAFLDLLRREDKKIAEQKKALLELEAPKEIKDAESRT